MHFISRLDKEREREREEIQPSPSPTDLCQYHCINTRGHFASFNWSPSILFDCARVNLRTILFRHNEDVLDTSGEGDEQA